jgi:small redox-active disulfide protein 1
MNSPTLLELFYSPICPTCPHAREVAREVAEECKVRLLEINIMSPYGQEQAKGYGITSVPTIVVNKRRRLVGMFTAEEIANLIEEERKRGEDIKN